ncbi:hypothetical protein GOODEAATRI_032018, partial [Goodea atripinnis]
AAAPGQIPDQNHRVAVMSVAGLKKQFHKATQLHLLPSENCADAEAGERWFAAALRQNNNSLLMSLLPQYDIPPRKPLELQLLRNAVSRCSLHPTTAGTPLMLRNQRVRLLGNPPLRPADARRDLCAL